MQCLYCKKRLGLFAFGRPFCSKSHEVAYQDAQSGFALLRLLDPMFMQEPLKAEPGSLKVLSPPLDR
jgi:hypothetical protein